MPQHLGGIGCGPSVQVSNQILNFQIIRLRVNATGFKATGLPAEGQAQADAHSWVLSGFARNRWGGFRNDSHAGYTPTYCGPSPLWGDRSRRSPRSHGHRGS